MCVRARVCVCVRARVFLCMFVRTRVCVHIEREREGEMREGGREKEIWKEKAEVGKMFERVWESRSNEADEGEREREIVR